MDLNLNKKEFIEYADSLICSQSNVDFSVSDLNTGNFTIDILAKKFLSGYDLSHHNYFKVGEDENVLCYDLMACLNPYEANKKQQYFYTLFSKRENVVEKQVLAWIYEEYIHKFNKMHIDLMLQICYQDPLFFKKENDEYTSNLLFDIQRNGICLQLVDENENKMYKMDPGSPLYIIVDKDTLQIVNNIISSERIQHSLCVEINKIKRIIQEEDIDTIKALEREKEKIDIEGLMQIIEEVINNELNAQKEHPSENLQINIKSLLKNYTDPTVYKNFIRICLINILSVPEIKYLYFIPLPFPNKMQAGHFVYSSKKQISQEEISKMRIISNALMFPFVQANIIFNYVNEVKKQTIKSAVSAIMSRNMSHNIGSHVLTNARYQVSYLAENALFDNGIKAEIQGISNLLQYIQERQDFIAVIANDDKYGTGSMNLKRDVFDMLAMDGLSKRHGTSKNVTNYILDSIVKSENIFRELVIRNNKEEDNGEYEYKPHQAALKHNLEATREGRSPIELALHYKDADGNIYKVCSLQDDQADAELANIQIAIPYGINGRQALLTILENIIRNSAKHGKKNINVIKRNNSNFKLTFTIAVNEIKDEDYYEIVIFDNLSDLSGATSAMSYKEDRKKGRANGVIDPNGKICNINILDPENRIDRTNKGIKEILICLNWIKGSNNYSKIEENANDLLSVVGVKESRDLVEITDLCDLIKNESEVKNAYSLGYKFRLKKYLDYYPLKSPVPDGKNTKELRDWFTKLPAAYLYTVENKEDLNRAKLYLSRVVEKNGNQSFKDLLKNYFDQYHGFNEQNPRPYLHISDNTRADFKIKSDGNKDEDYDLVITGRIKKEEIPSDLSMNNKRGIVKYITHYENDAIKDSTTQLPLLPDGCLFKEGISGGNFTHNLIRIDKITEEHYYKVMDAALKKIAIVDERLFNRFNGVMPKEVARLDDIIEKVRDIIIKNPKPFSDLYSYLNSLKSKDGFLHSEFPVKEVNKLDIKTFELYLKKKYKEPELPINPISDYLDDKGIFVLNSDETGQLIDLTGKVVKQLRNRKGTLVDVDYISIHLSLLEKMRNSTESMSNGIKDNLIKVLNDAGINKTAKVAIHSGRGGLADISDITFIPLSGIDWAIGNCKYVLEELYAGQKYYPLNRENKI